VLELSGIGDPEVLRKADVEVVINLPGVGNNVQEHLNISIAHRTSSHLELFQFNAEELSRGKERVRSKLHDIR
jgi:choline dehydrogenase-like flavoprotein